MAVWERLGGVARQIGDKTSDVMESTRLTTRAAAEKRAAREEVEKIGSFYYGLFEQSGTAAAEVEDFCRAAKAHYDAAQRYRAELERLSKRPQTCPTCGAKATGSARFCAACGAALHTGEKQ